MAQWEGYVERLRVALPAAPENLLDGYVRWIPWVYLGFGVLGFLALLVLLPFGAAVSALGIMAGVSSGAPVLRILFALVLTALEIAGGYLMLKRRATGWWIVALGMVVNLLQSLLGGGALGLIITLLLAYLHVQVRPRYS